MLQIYWGFMPVEVRESVQPLLRQWLFVLPDWVNRLYVSWGDKHESAEGARCQISATPAYRYLQLTVYGSWLNDHPIDRRRSIIHEMSHIPHAPLAIHSKTFVEEMLTDAPLFRGRELKAHGDLVEAVTEDWTQVLMKLPVEALPIRSDVEELEDECPSRPGDPDRGVLMAAS